jgi:hypothetical protein
MSTQHKLKRRKIGHKFYTIIKQYEKRNLKISQKNYQRRNQKSIEHIRKKIFQNNIKNIKP